MARPGPRQRGYGAAWERARAEHLAAHPWCATCEHDGKLTRAVHVHHSTPHKGDMQLFWDRSRWVSLCVEHHNRDAQQVETRGYSNRVREDGTPADPRHPFNRGHDDEPETTDARHGPRLSPRRPIGKAALVGAAKGGPGKAGGHRGAGPIGDRPSQLVSSVVDSGGA